MGKHKGLASATVKEIRIGTQASRKEGRVPDPSIRIFGGSINRLDDHLNDRVLTPIIRQVYYCSVPLVVEVLVNPYPTLGQPRRFAIRAVPLF